MRPLALICLLLCLTAAPVRGQVFLSELVTNSDIQPDSELTLLVLHGGDDDQLAAQLLGMLARPQTQALKQWVDNCNVKSLPITHVLAAHSHEDLLAKHAAFPIIALVEVQTRGEGAVWWSASPPELRVDEQWIAGTLTQYYQATMEAKARAPQQPQAELNGMPPYYIGDEPPAPYKPRRRPSILNPPTINVNHQAPDQINTNVTAGLNTESLRTLLITGGFFVLGMAILAYAIISHARTMADAETMDPEEYQRLYGAGPIEPTNQPTQGQ